MKYEIVGNIFDTSGYSIHTRELFNALAKIADVKLTTAVIPDWYRFVNDKELEAIKKDDEEERIKIIITTPNYWKLHTNAKRNWVYLVWEGDKIPKSWIEECLNPDIEYIFVPSYHTSTAIKNTLETMKDTKVSGVSILQLIVDKIKVIQHGVDLKKFYPHSPAGKSGEPVEGSPRRPFTFLANKGFRNMQDRGGIQYLIQAYLEEFTKEDNVKLILKINPAYGFNPELVKQCMENSNAKSKESPIISVNAENIEYNKLVDLYNQCDVFVSPTRAEAFNIPCLEAMACGKPVITTDFGGQTDYCTKETGWIIGGQMEEVMFDVQYEGIKWLTPDLKQLRKALREAYTKEKDLLNTFSNNALIIAKKLTWENTAKLILTLK